MIFCSWVRRGNLPTPQCIGMGAYLASNRVTHSPESDEDGDEHGADGVGDHQVVLLHQDGGDDHPDAAQSVGHNVQKHS